MSKYLIPEEVAKLQSNSFEHIVGAIGDWCAERDLVLLATHQSHFFCLDDSGVFHLHYSFDDGVLEVSGFRSYDISSSAVTDKKGAGLIIHSKISEAVSAIKSGDSNTGVELLIAISESVQNGSSDWVVDSLIGEIESLRFDLTEIPEREFSHHVHGKFSVDNSLSSCDESMVPEIRSSLLRILEMCDKLMVYTESEYIGLAERLRGICSDALLVCSTSPVKKLGLICDESADALLKLAYGILPQEHRNDR